MFNPLDSVSDLLAYLVTDIDLAENNPTVQFSPVGVFKRNSDNTLITEILLTVSANVTDVEGNLLSEKIWFTGGTETVDANNNPVVQYTATLRKLGNNIVNNPPVAADQDGVQRSHSSGAECVIDEGWLFRYIYNTFREGSTEDTATTGEVIGARKVVAIDSTDGLLYLFDDSNTDHVLVGISKAAYASGVTATYTLTGGRSTGFSGLTAGAIQYASTSVAGDITEVSTPFPIGNASADGTYINVFISPGGVTIASQAEAEAGVNNVNVMTPLRTRQAIDSNKVETLWLLPPAFGVMTLNSEAITANTNAWCFYVNVLQPINANSITFRLNASTTPSTWDIAIFDDAGDNVLYSDTTGSMTGTNYTHTLASTWELPAGRYIFSMVANGAVNTTFTTGVYSVIGEATGKNTMGGFLTVTAGTLPTSIDMAALTTPLAEFPFIRFDN